MISPGSVRVRLRYVDLATFIQRFAPNVTRGGIFLASRAPRPPGDVFHFEVQLAGGQIALSGEGKVIWVKEWDPNEPQKPHGMGVQFISIDPGSRATLNQILTAKRPANATPAGGMVAGTLRHGDSGRVGRNGSAAAPRVDTNVDLAAEFGFDDATLRRAVDRVRTTGAREAEEDLEALQRPDAAEPATLAQALAELPRLLDPARRRTGPFRTMEMAAVSDRTAPTAQLAAELAAEHDPPTPPVEAPTGEAGAHDESTP